MDASELLALRSALKTELAAFFNFFDSGGVDHVNGGFCCGLAHDGRRLSGLKFIWFNGRGVWTYAKAYNTRTGLLAARDWEPPERLAGGRDTNMSIYLHRVAIQGLDFALKHGRVEGATDWVVEMSATGEIITPAEPNYIPTTGYGMAFVAEGCIEAFFALLDNPHLHSELNSPLVLGNGLTLLRRFVRMMDDPDRPGDKGVWPVCTKGMRCLGHYMICMNLTRQVYNAVVEAKVRGIDFKKVLQGMAEVDDAVATEPPSKKQAVGTDDDPYSPILAELTALLDRMIDCILGPFLHPEYNLLSETLSHDFSRPDDGNYDLIYLGHAVETLWMLMALAEERHDESLYARAAYLFRRHVDCAWDPLCGGYFRGVYAKEWKPLLDADAKVKWMHDEVCVGCMMLLAHPPLDVPTASSSSSSTEDDVPSGGEAMVTWAARTLRKTREYVEKNFRLASWPGSWKVGGDRYVKPDPDPDTAISGYNMGCKSLPNRVEHYHHPRMLMLGIGAVDRAIARLNK